MVKESFSDILGLISDYSCVVSRLLQSGTVTLPDLYQGSDIAGIVAHDFQSGVYESLVEYGHASVKACVSAEGIPSKSYTVTEPGRESLTEQDRELAACIAGR